MTSSLSWLESCRPRSVTSDASERSALEEAYIAAMSRKEVVDAYASWTEVTRAENACLELAFMPGTRVLDLGCGAGRFALRLGRQASRYLGIDASPAMIQVARRNCPDRDFAVGDIVEFDAGAGQWDLVLLMGNVLDCLHPEERRTLELQRCAVWLHAGGWMVGSSHLTERGQDRGYYSEDYHGAVIQNHRAALAEIVDEVESHGFEVALICRDYRETSADWCYWAGRLL